MAKKGTTLKQRIQKLHSKIRNYLEKRKKEKIHFYYPPLFYLTHTQEEIDRVIAQELEEAKKMVDEYF